METRANWLQTGINAIKANVKPILISVLIANPLFSTLSFGFVLGMPFFISYKIYQKIKEYYITGTEDFELKDFEVGKYFLEGLKFYFFLIISLLPVFILSFLTLACPLALLLFTNFITIETTRNSWFIFLLMILIMGIIFLITLLSNFIAAAFKYYYTVNYEKFDQNILNFTMENYKRVFKDPLKTLHIGLITAVFSFIIYFILLLPAICSLLLLSSSFIVLADIFVLSYFSSKETNQKSNT